MSAPWGGVGSQGVGVYGPPSPKVNVTSLVAFGLALAAWVVLPVVGSILALFFASRARSEIKASNGLQTGIDYANWARIISWIHLACTGTAMALGILLLIVKIVVISS